jgi:hypothetical protein
MKTKYLLIIIVLLYSCTGKVNEQRKQDLAALIIQTIEKENIDDKENQLYLFVADYMCVECVVKEYMNIKNEGIPIDLIGVFDSKRNFAASAGTASVKNKIFINRREQNINNIPVQPFYFIYNKKTKTISEVFYPAACEEGKTISYFQKVKKLI